METSGIVHAKYVSDVSDEFVDDFELEEEQSFGSNKTMEFREKDVDDDTLLSPDTNEFLALEQQVIDEEQRDHFQSTPTRNSCSAHVTAVENQGPSIIVRTASYTERSPSSLEQEHLLQLEQQKQLLQSELETKLEERKRSIDAAENLVMDEEGQLQVTSQTVFLIEK